MATEELPHTTADRPTAMALPLGTGALLREAREAAGMSLDQVAAQLKLAPRQVKALEEERFGELPGRTFSRGFVRNYARLLALDPEDVLAHLPDVEHAPALESPTLHSTGSMIAELPSSAASRPSLGRWLIPLVLIGCIVAAAAYERYRGGAADLSDRPRGTTAAPEKQSVKLALAQSATPLPNPLIVAPAASGEAAPQEQKEVDATAAEAGGDAPLVLSFAGPSWTEVRDSRGQLLVSRLIVADTVEAVHGTPPFDVLLGNARVVALTYLGKPVDLTPYTRRNVARLSLK